MSKYCSHCGFKVDENVTYCANCGANLKTDAATPPPTQPDYQQPAQSTPPPAQPVYQQPAQPTPEGYDPTTKVMGYYNADIATWLCLIGIIVGGFVSFIGLVFAYRGRKAGEPEKKVKLAMRLNWAMVSLCIAMIIYLAVGLPIMLHFGVI